MLTEPPVDATLDALDRDLLAALRARIQAGARTSVDAEILALRAQLDTAETAEIPLLRALLGRLDAATGAVLTVWGPAARTLPDDRHRQPLALMIETRPSGPTGDDRTFWVSDSPLPDSKIVAALEAAGLVASPLIATGGLKLFMLAGYLQADDPRLTGAPGSLAGIIGAAPVF